MPPRERSVAVEALWAPDLEPAGAEVRGGSLPDELRARYAAPLGILLRPDRPTIVANFVSTLDGVVALDRDGATGGQEISGGSDSDRFVMGLLRSLADVVVVGAGTVRASRTHGWTAALAHPPSAPAFARWREALGLNAAGPATVIVSGSGALDPRHLPSSLGAPVIVATTARGARRLEALGPPGHLDVVALGAGPSLPVQRLIEFLEARGFRLVLTEGGPSLFGQLLDARVVDEVFLTLAPQLAGRAAGIDRLSLVEDVALTPSARWGHLRSVLRSSDHLFLRYALPQPERKVLP
jgi:riboflavin biosynthesis pyrimidine reductase